MSDLEETFAYLVRCQGAHFPQPVRQHRFAPPRKWTWDFSWPDRKVAVEIEGAVWTAGRHVRGAGFLNDLEKHNQAALLGWTVGRFGAKHLDDLSCVRWLEEALHAR